MLTIAIPPESILISDTIHCHNVDDTQMHFSQYEMLLILYEPLQSDNWRLVSVKLLEQKENSV